ncbi:MAG TPA: DUF1638 domain-containing protein [Bryobacteraceae bacterium]|nr:DUF1638 domain-containing protein [Bryobacteraceae bacterium]
MRIKVISCDVLYRELCSAASRSPHQVDVQFLPKGLHQQGCRPMRFKLQEEIDKSSGPRYDAIVLGYALCGNGTVGLTSRSVPVVIPRAHDCTTVLMGGLESHQQYMAANSRVLFRSTGWLERDTDVDQIKSELVRGRAGAGYTLEDLVSRYGEENGRYLYEQFSSYEHSFRQLTFIETGVEPSRKFEALARAEAARRGLDFDKVPGSMRLFDAMVSGDWSVEDFLVVPPGHRVVEKFDGTLIGIEKARP